MAKTKTLKRSFSFSKYHLLALALIFGLVGGYVLYRSFAAGTINVWVSTTGNDSTCARGDQSKPCATVNKAYAIAQAGDNVQVACGTYSSGTIFNSRKSSGANVMFQPVTDYCATIPGLDYTNGGDYSTFTGFNIVDSQGAVYSGVAIPGTTHSISLIHNHINVNKRVDTQNVNMHSCADCQFIANTIGPTCCGVGANSPEGMRFGVASFNGNVNAMSNNVLIDGNIIQSTIRDCSDWPSTYMTAESSTPLPTGGICPSTTCNTGCHSDGIHVFGMTNSTISRNRILDVGVQGIFFEPTGLAVNSANKIINNMISTSANDTNKCGICINGSASSASISGAWTIAFNSMQSRDQITINEQTGGSAGATTFNLVGNLAALYIAGGGCQGFADSNVSATYNHNAWVTINGGTNQVCGPGDVYPFTTSFVNDLYDPHLTAANHIVPAAACGLITTVDLDGQTRPANGGTSCDAGADEFGASSGPTFTPGDINHDGSVNGQDLSILLANWQASTPNADIDSSGTVDIFDLSILLSHFAS